MATKRYREEFKNPLDEGKLVAEWEAILKFMLKKLGQKLGKEYQKNTERGIASINSVGALIGFKVTDKKQEKGKLFLKFGDNLGEEILNEEDAAIRAAKLKAQQVGEMEQLKQKQVAEMDAMKERHERENEKIALDKEKEAANKAIDAERESARKAAQNEERNYKKEYENYHGKKEQIARRSKRNEARRSLKNRKDIEGKDVHHKDNNPMNNDKSNLSIVSQHFNRREPRLREGIDSDAMIDLMQKYLNTKNKNEKKTILKQINKYQKKLGLKVTEALGKNATQDDYIKDFLDSDAPQFKGKTKDKIIQMAVAAFKDKQNG